MICLPLCVAQWFVILLTVLTTLIGLYNLVRGFEDEAVTVEMVFGDEGISGAGPKLPARAEKYRTSEAGNNFAATNRTEND